MRIVFVPEDEVTEEPEFEVGDPGDEAGIRTFVGLLENPPGDVVLLPALFPPATVNASP